MNHDLTAPRFKTQDPKYDIQDGKLINADTGVPIPQDEPVFLLRAQDSQAYVTVSFYAQRCRNVVHRSAVLDRAWDFSNFARENFDRMKSPTTAWRTYVGTASALSSVS